MRPVKQRKLPAILTVIAMLLAILPTMAFAADIKGELPEPQDNALYSTKALADNSVCKIGATEFSSLPEAISTATAGQEIVLLGDIELTEKLTINNNVTLNIGTHTLSSTVTRGAAIEIKAEVIIKGSGIIQGANRESSGPTATAYVLQVFQDAKLTLENVTVQPGETQTKSSTASATTGVYVTRGNLILNGATVKGGNSIGEGRGGNALYIFNDSDLKAENATIIGGSFERTAARNNSGGNAVYLQSNSNAILNNCTVTGGSAKSALQDYYSASGGTAVWIQNKGKVVVTGGTVTGGAAGNANGHGYGGEAVYTPGGTEAELSFSGVNITGGNSDKDNGGSAFNLSGSSTVTVADSTVKGGNGGKYAGTAINLSSYSAKGTFNLQNASVSGGQGFAYGSDGVAINLGGSNADDHITVSAEGSLLSGAEDGNSVYAMDAAIEKEKLTLKDSQLIGQVKLQKTGGGYHDQLSTDYLKKMSGDLAQDIWQNKDGNLQFGAAPLDEQDMRPILNTTTNTYYINLQRAFTDANSGDTIKLLEDVTTTNHAILTGKALTLDLNGKTYTYNGQSGYGAIYVGATSGTCELTLIDSGATKGALVDATGLYLGRAITLQGTGCKAIIDRTATVRGQIAVVPQDNGFAELVVNGTIDTRGIIGKYRDEAYTVFAIAGNGSYKGPGTKITINKGAQVLSDAGIYHPHTGILEIYGKVLGEECIAMKSGSLIIGDGAELIATGAYVEPTNPHDNGIYGSGAAIQLEANSAYSGNIKVSVSDGAKVTSQNGHAIYKYGTAEDKFISIDITGGEFTSGTYEGKKLSDIAIADETNAAGKVSISGGLFSHKVDPDFCAEGYAPTPKKNGSYSVCNHSEGKVVKNAKAATCTDKGYTGDEYCTQCEAKLSTGKEIPVTDHNWKNNFTVDKQPTATQNGSKSIHCQNCDAVKGITSIPAIGPQPTTVTPEDEVSGKILIVNEATSEQKAELTAAVTGPYKNQFSGKKIWMLDINLIDTATWEAIHDEQVTFIIGYPAGITSENYTQYDFVVLHQKPDGSMEVIDAQATKNGLKITSTLSPFAIGYSLKPTQPGHSHDFGSPKTGDNSNLLLWICLLALSVALGALVFALQKRRK